MNPTGGCPFGAVRGMTDSTSRAGNRNLEQVPDTGAACADTTFSRRAGRMRGSAAARLLPSWLTVGRSDEGPAMVPGRARPAARWRPPGRGASCPAAV